MLIQLIDLLFLVYTGMIFIRILGSWFPEWAQHRFMLFISFYTDPYLNVFRRFIPPLGMLDISPMVALFCLGFFKRFIQYLLISIF